VVSDDLVKQALAELGDIVRCRCHAAYTDRKLHDPDCNCDSAEALQIVSGRIEALQAQLAERDKACAEWAEVSQRNYQRAKTAEADRDQWRSMWEKEQTDNEQLQAQLADEMQLYAEWRGRAEALQTERDEAAMLLSLHMKRATAAEAQLAKAREDGFAQGLLAASTKVPDHADKARILALIDTPAPSPDALVKAALEYAKHLCQKNANRCQFAHEDGRHMLAIVCRDDIRAAATDPATVAAIIERAGK
jgi:hypothetical protein